MTEIRGPRHHPRIIEYFQTVILDAALKIDETSWCAAFMNWILPPQYRTQSALARSFMTVGEEVWNDSHESTATDNAREGDICVFFDRTSSYRGHTGLFIAYNSKRTRVLVLGGNQSNSVCYKWFPVRGKSLYLKSIRRVA